MKLARVKQQAHFLEAIARCAAFAGKKALLALMFCAVALQTAIAGAAPQPSIDPAQLEQDIHRQINQVRQNHGLAPLHGDERLAAIARNHSRDMAAYGFFSHTNLHGENPSARAKKLGWDKKKQTGPHAWLTGVAENLVLNHLYDKVVTTTQDGVAVEKHYFWKTRQEIVQSTVQQWLNSPPHRKTMLSPQHNLQGIGVAISGNDIYVTQDLF